MNQNKKGFTLTELLATIAIISVITLMATITYTKVRKDIVNKEYINLKTLIQTAATKYASKYGNLTFFVQDLIDDNLIEPDDDVYIYDPRDHHPLNCHLIQIEIDKNDNYTATISKKDYKDGDICNNPEINIHDQSLTLTAVLNPSNKAYDVTNTSNSYKYSEDYYGTSGIYNYWTRQDLKITVNLDYNGHDTIAYQDSIVGAKYIWNKNTDRTTIEPNRSIITNEKEYYNGNYYLDMYTKSGEHFQGRLFYKFDRQAPVIYQDKTRYVNPSDENVWAKKKEIFIYASDNEGVGLDRVYAGTRPCSDMVTDRNMGKAATNSFVNTYTVDDVEAGTAGENGLINVCAIDKLGNLSETAHFNIKRVDITPPNCDRVDGAHNQYQYSSRTIHQYCNDNNVINGKDVIGSGCTQDPFPKTFNPDAGTAVKIGYITITDNVGWTTDCPVDAYVDRKGPNCSSTSGEGSKNSWVQQTREITQYCTDDHVGCKKSSYTKRWSPTTGSTDYYTATAHGDAIKNDTIRIYDRVPKCSQTSTLNSNCSNYETIKNEPENLDNYNNHTDCSVGVYLDWKDPEARLSPSSGCAGSTTTEKCSDDESGIASGGGTTHNFSNTSSVNITCTDKAGNSVTKSKTFTVYDCNPSGGGSFCDTWNTTTTLGNNKCKVCFPTTCYSWRTCESNDGNNSSYEEGTDCMTIPTTYVRPEFGCATWEKEGDGNPSGDDPIIFDKDVTTYATTSDSAKWHIYKKYCTSSGCSNTSNKYYAYVNVQPDANTDKYKGERWYCTSYNNFYGHASGNYPDSDCHYWKCVND